MCDKLKTFEELEGKKEAIFIQSQSYTNVREEDPNKYYKNKLNAVDKIILFEKHQFRSYYPSSDDKVAIFKIHNGPKKLNHPSAKNALGVYYHRMQYGFLDLTDVNIEELVLTL